MATLMNTVQRRLGMVLLGLSALALSACTQTAGMIPGAAGTRSVDANKKVTVALMAPLDSGQAELDFLASSLVNAARLARNDLSGIDMDLRIYPTGGDAVRAQTAARQALAEGAQILVGPLFTTATASVAPVAAERGVSVLSFSNNAAIAGGNVFVLGTTFDTIANRVVSYSVGQGRGNVGVVHSNDPGGLAGLDAAQKAIRRFGGNFVGAAGYDLQPPVAISNAAGGIARQMRAQGANAVVFTDDPASGLPFLLPVLAANDLSSNDAGFLGLTRWNILPEVAALPSLQGGVFAAPDPSLQSAFEQRYSSTYGRAPHALAGLAYDGVAAVGAMISAAQTANGRALTRAQITDGNGFAGVTGIFRFGDDGVGERGLALFRLSGGRAVVVDPAPRSFGPGL